LSKDSGYSVLSQRKFHIQLERSMNGVVTFSNQWLLGWPLLRRTSGASRLFEERGGQHDIGSDSFGMAIGVTLLLGYLVGRSRQRRAKAGSPRDSSDTGTPVTTAMPEATMPGAMAEAINAVHGGKPGTALCASAAGLFRLVLGCISRSLE
jgi:hypothetical protein